MERSNRRALEFFRERDGSLPVADWLDSLPKEVRAKFAAHIEKLAQHGPTLDFPFTNQIEGRVAELSRSHNIWVPGPFLFWKGPVYHRHSLLLLQVFPCAFVSLR